MPLFPSKFAICFKEFYLSGKPHVKMLYKGRVLGCLMHDKPNFPQGMRYADAFSVVYRTHIGQSYVLTAYAKAKEIRSEEEKEECLRVAFLTNPYEASVEKFTAIIADKLCYHSDRGYAENRFITLAANHRRAAGMSAMPYEALQAMIRDYYNNHDALCAHKGGVLVCDTIHKKVTFEKRAF